METIPYDRGTITMNEFPMCPSCSDEYTGDDRRRHAQTISCRECGPQLILAIPGLTLHKDMALSRSIEILGGGGVLAIKGIGGYQLACRPDLPAAVDSLRKFKNSDRKPFAVMFPNLKWIKDICIVSLEEEKLLLSTARPIVLLSTERPKLPRSSSREDSFCPEVIAESRFLGAFLPYTALHHQLTEACGPLIMTSANLSGEPILFRDEDIQVGERIGAYVLAQELVFMMVRRVVVGHLIPLLRARGNDERARRDDVRFEPAKIAFKSNSDIAATGGSGHLVVGIGLAQPRLIGDGADNHFIGDDAHRFDGADGDDIFGCAGRGD